MKTHNFLKRPRVEVVEPRASPLCPTKLVPVPRANLRVKRGLDLALGIPIFLTSVPVFLAVWIAYKISTLRFSDDRGPVFFKVYRHSFSRAIPVYKVRLSKMSYLSLLLEKIDDQQIERLGQHLSETDNALIRKNWRHLVEDSGYKPTRFGKLLKAIYLDELPQIINVIKGDISLVGPRPLPLWDPRVQPNADGYVTIGGRLFDYRHRDLIPGGLTGLYQANKSVDAKRDYGRFIREGVELDRYYYEMLKRARPWQVIKIDVLVILRTLPVITRREGV